MSALTVPPARAPLVVVKGGWMPEELAARVRTWTPRTDLGLAIRKHLNHLPAEAAAEILEIVWRSVVIESSVYAVAIRTPRSRFWAGEAHEDHGVVGRKVITTAGVGFLVDAWQNILELEIMKYHALGTGSTAEASGDTALVTELTTEYTGNVRATGSLTEGASANIFRSVGTNTLDSGTPAVIEHGLMSQAATGGGTLWDRTKFGGSITLDGTAGDGLQTTYDVTCSAGG